MHWAQRTRCPVRGALLAAPPDFERPMPAPHHLLIPYAASRAPGAQEALKGLALPHLDRLLARLSTADASPGEETSLTPPHERALALSPEQKPAFEAFKADMKARGERMATAMAERRGTVQPKTALERMAAMEEMSKQRAVELADARESVGRFYATLSDAQKTVFDAEFQRMGPRGSKGERGMRDGMGDGPRHGGMGSGRG